MLPTLAILPAKSFAAAKQRLAAALATGPRRALAEAMLSDMLVALRGAAAVDSILVVTSDAGARRIAGDYGTVVLEDYEQGHNAAARLGIRHALEAGADRALLVPGDCPLLEPAHVDELVARAGVGGARSALIVPDRHGTGTNALLLTPPDALVPAFGPGSCRRHAVRARAACTAHEIVEVPSLALDVDTPDDLAALELALAGTHAGAAHTREALGQTTCGRSPGGARC
jgi:2-phospho-L-lactate guanylyltransferase